MIDYDKVLRNDEHAILKLRQLFGLYGYQRFKTGKFEEYELYARNKDFIGNDGILTFTDSKGNLIALKPDVTLSIAKNTDVVSSEVQKFWYDDEVYRLSKWSGTFREIPQMGIECIGNIGGYDVCEVIILAVRSLNLIDENYIMDLSHMGIVRGITSLLELTPEAEEKVLQCIGGKNIHGALKICKEHSVPDNMCYRLKDLISIYGPIDEMVDRLNQLAMNDTMKSAVDELKVVVSALKAQNLEKHVRFDFSVVNDMGYYNGVIFQGFVEGIASAILSGGRYDNLIWKMGHKDAGAIGFSISMGELTELNRQCKDVDVDVVILDNPEVDLVTLNRIVSKYTDEGNSVSVQKSIPKNLRYSKLVQIDNGEVKTVETDN